MTSPASSTRSESSAASSPASRREVRSRSTRPRATRNGSTGSSSRAPHPTGRSEGGSAFADACRSDYPAAVDQFVERCFPEPDSDHVKRWAQEHPLARGAGAGSRIIEMWRDEDVPDVDPTQIDIPTLILHGTADAIVPIERQPSARGAAPGRRAPRVRGQRPRPDDDATERRRRRDPAPLPLTVSSRCGRSARSGSRRDRARSRAASRLR